VIPGVAPPSPAPGVAPPSPAPGVAPPSPAPGVAPPIPAPRLLAITPPTGAIDPELVDAWLDAGAATLDLAVLLREPGLGLTELLAAERLLPLRRRLAERGVPAITSLDARDLDARDLDRVSALLAAADPPIAGVQLRGDPSLATLARVRPRVPGLLGRSCHGDPQLGDEQVDYTVLAPIFAPHTRTPGLEKSPIGLAGLRRWTATPRHLLALGGITPANAGQVLAAGASGIAGISLVFGQPSDAADNVAALVRVFAVEVDRHASPPR
jgi:thiamine monophosphate synthase